MHESEPRAVPDDCSSSAHAIARLRQDVRDGAHWAEAVFRAMGQWADAEEEVAGRRYRYFIGGEAFDRLLLAERLLSEIAGEIPEGALEDFTVLGILPDGIDEDRVQNLLGVEKYRGHLNFHYGVTVEETLQLAVEQEVIKRYASNGIRRIEDPTEEAFARIYGAGQTELAARFRHEEAGEGCTPVSLDETPMTMSECKEFTYWLFKLRLRRSDKPKIASDTRKGLDQLQKMRMASNAERRKPPVGAGTAPGRTGWVRT